MIESSIEELFDSINNSKEYKEYIEITSILNENIEVKELIDEIKQLQQKAVQLEYNEDDNYKELDKLIEEKTKILNENKNYQEYLSKVKDFNKILLASSSLLDTYIEEKVSI